MTSSAITQKAMTHLRSLPYNVFGGGGRFFSSNFFLFLKKGGNPGELSRVFFLSVPAFHTKIALFFFFLSFLIFFLFFRFCPFYYTTEIYIHVVSKNRKKREFSTVKWLGGGWVSEEEEEEVARGWEGGEEEGDSSVQHPQPSSSRCPPLPLTK